MASSTMSSLLIKGNLCTKSMDFVTDLPSAQGFNTIWVVVDQISMDVSQS